MENGVMLPGKETGGEWIRWLFLLAFMAILPWIFKTTGFADYLTYIVVRIMILGIFAMSYDIIYGYTGMMGFGHAAFMGGAAYAVAILMLQLGLNIQDAMPGILAGLLVGVIIGWIQGFLSCKLGHLATFLVTFALTEMIFLLVMADPLGITNGENGLAGIPRETFLGFVNIRPELNFYYFVMILLCLSYLALRAITRMPIGETLLAIRENPQRARFLGYRIRQYRIVAFMISGFFAALAGTLTAFHEGSAAPEMFGVFESGFALLFTVVGGAGTLIGPVLGVVILVVIIEILSGVFQYYMLFVGLSLSILIMFLPKGLYPLLQRIRIRRPGAERAESPVLQNEAEIKTI
jgi:branched-chain amino acid transport system permease protein